MTALVRLRAWFLQRRERVVSRTVVCDETSVAQFDWLGNREVETRLAWEDVGLVVAYKRDCYIVDQIRIAVAHRTDRVCVDISEEDGGYRALTAALPRYLPGCPAMEEWFDHVAFPAFETNWTVLYRRD